MTEKELQDYLDAFKTAVENADLTNSNKINFFSATKMLTLETKHSAFLAWLLDPSLEHCLKSAVLEKLLTKLYNYQTVGDKKTANPKNNMDILKDNKQGKHNPIVDLQDIINICNSSTIEVDTEHYTTNNKRIDILLRITDANNERTVIVIENKIDSSAHDNQICEYQDYIFNGSNEYSNYERKIFIYLTKFGELPYNIGGNGNYNNVWCVFDYSKIVEIIVEIIGELKKNNYQITQPEKEKLLHILEDYKDMVDTIILNNSNIARDKCKNLLADNKVHAAFDILTAYMKIYTPAQISDYVRQYLNGKRDGNSNYWFYIDIFKEYFEKKGEQYLLPKLRVVCQEDSSKMVIFVDVSNEKNNPKTFTPAQIKLLDAYGGNTNGQDVRIISTFTLVNTNEMGKNFEELQPILNRRIDDFKKDHLDKLVNILNSL